MKYAIGTINLTKEFLRTKTLTDILFQPFKRKEATLAIDNVNLQVEKGRGIWPCRAKWSRKTTLIKLYCCLILPTCGRAYVNGYDILKEGDGVKRL